MFDKLSKNPDAIRAENEGVWRWLVRAGKYRAADELRRIRRRRTSTDREEEVLVLALPLDLASSDPSPERRAMTNEAIDKLKHLLDEISEEDAIALLQDMSAVDAYKTLTGEALREHDEQACTNSAVGCYTVEALQKRRQRLRQRIQHELKGYLP